jgi:hypothetical protein
LIDTEVYNMVWGTSVDDRVLMVTFTLPSGLEDKWIPIGNTILTSARINEGAGETSGAQAGGDSQPANKNAGGGGS